MTPIDHILEHTLKTPAEWLQEPRFKGTTIIDPDGWRGKRGKDFDEPIGILEFEGRLMQSTIRHDSTTRT